MVTWLEALVAAKWSDLHLKVGPPPRMRVDGRLVVLLEDALSAATNPHDLQVALRSQGLVA